MDQEKARGGAKAPDVRGAGTSVTRIRPTTSVAGIRTGTSVTRIRAAGSMVLVGLCTWACTGDAASSGRGGEVATWGVGVEPTVVIGEPGRGPAYDLHRVVDATRLSDGTMVVANGGTSELRWYSPAGVHLRSAGGEGDGPGEFRQMVAMRRLPGDTLLAFGWRSGLAWFGPGGELVRTGRYDPSGLELPCRIAEEGHLFPDGTLLRTLPEGPFHGVDCPVLPDGRHQPPTLLVRLDPESGRFDSLGIFPGTERTAGAFAAYGRELDFAIGPDRLVVGATGSEEIHVLSLDGDTLDIFATPWEAAPVPASARTVRGPTRELPDGEVEVTRDYVYPELYPRFGRIMLDEEGHLWVMAYPHHDDPGRRSGRFRQRTQADVEEGGARWRVLSPEGAWVAEVRTPPGLFPLEVGRGYVLGVTRDALDVQRVQMHTLRREASTP